jgi:2-polyprenyl-3-methyl-5-hydroxy-6-metoxy-1,4-benzoquinol methylase
MNLDSDRLTEMPLWKQKLDRLVLNTLINPTNPNRKRWVERKEQYFETHTTTMIEILGQKLGNLEGLKVLDLGCGSGLDAINLARAGAIVTGIEVVPELVEIAKLRATSEGVSVKFLTVDARTEWFWPGHYDAVTIIDVWEHAEQPESITADCAQLLRPGGIVILTTTNRWALQNILADPHWKLFGVTLLPRVLAEVYVVRIRRILRRYDVTSFKGLSSLRKLLYDRGFKELEDNVSDLAEKLASPTKVRGAFKRWVAKITSKTVGAKPLRTLLAWLYCYTFVRTWRIVGKKPVVET